MEIEYAEYKRFLKAYNDGEYECLRLGQAFYNHFNLHKLSNQRELDKLYESDGVDAKRIISEIFVIR